MADGEGGLEVIDVEDPAVPFSLETDVRPSGVVAVSVSGNRVFLSEDESGVEVLYPCGGLPIFLDDFERGNLSRWSSTVP